MARVKVAHYAARSLQGTELAWTLRDEQGHVAGKGVCPIVSSGRGLLEVGDIRLPVPVTGKARRLNLELAIEGTDYKILIRFGSIPKTEARKKAIRASRWPNGWTVTCFRHWKTAGRYYGFPNGTAMPPKR